MGHANISLENLIETSRSSFEGDSKPPFGFATRMVAMIHADRRIREIELLSWRAFFCAAMAVLILLAFRMADESADDPEPGTSHLLSIDTAQDL